MAFAVCARGQYGTGTDPPRCADFRHEQVAKRTAEEESQHAIAHTYKNSFPLLLLFTHV